MSWLGDVYDFEKFNAGEMLRKIGKDPERIFIGAGDPLSSSVWGGILGKDYEPIVDQYGGASSDTYDKAQEKGINTGPGATMHGIARLIASFYGGKALGGLMGSAAGEAGAAGGEAGGAAGGASSSGGLLADGAAASASTGAAEGAGASGGLLSDTAAVGGTAGSEAGGMAGSSTASGGADAGTEASQAPTMMQKMKDATEYIKPIGQAANSAKSVSGLLSSDRKPMAAPQIQQSPGVGRDALATLAAQNQQSSDQQMALAAQQRAQRRQMYRGGA